MEITPEGVTTTLAILAAAVSVFTAITAASRGRVDKLAKIIDGLDAENDRLREEAIVLRRYVSVLLDALRELGATPPPPPWIALDDDDTPNVWDWVVARTDGITRNAKRPERRDG